jgi:hypothetical protein
MTDSAPPPPQPSPAASKGKYTGIIILAVLLIGVFTLQKLWITDDDRKAYEAEQEQADARRNPDQRVLETVVIQPDESETYTLSVTISSKLSVTIDAGDQLFSFVIVKQSDIEAYMNVPFGEKPPPGVTVIQELVDVPRVELTDVKIPAGDWYLIITPELSRETPLTVNVKIALD